MTLHKIESKKTKNKVCEIWYHSLEFHIHCTQQRKNILTFFSNSQRLQTSLCMAGAEHWQTDRHQALTALSLLCLAVKPFNHLLRTLQRHQSTVAKIILDFCATMNTIKLIDKEFTSIPFLKLLGFQVLKCFRYEVIMLTGDKKCLGLDLIQLTTALKINLKIKYCGVVLILTSGSEWHLHPCLLIIIYLVDPFLLTSYWYCGGEGS